MNVAYLVVETSNHHLIEEGIYTLEEFEPLANMAASITSPLDPSDILVTVYFGGHKEAELESTIEGVLHVHQRGDWGLMDWIGSAMAATEDKQIQDTLKSIDKQIH